MLAPATAGATSSLASADSDVRLLAVALAVSMAFAGKNYHVSKS
jgi:hypothetical protein